jgi:hypothetical protein
VAWLKVSSTCLVQTDSVSLIYVESNSVKASVEGVLESLANVNDSRKGEAVLAAIAAALEQNLSVIDIQKIVSQA